jgi:ATP-dependent Lhr-like helicase
MRDLGRLDQAAIGQVRSEAWPLVRDAEELHDVLLSQGALPLADAKPWMAWFEELKASGRATLFESMIVATERVPLAKAVWPDREPRPAVGIPKDVRQDWTSDEAVMAIVRGRMECVGPTTASAIVKTFSLDATQVEVALIALENEGVVLRGHFTGSTELEWCDRRLLARIHRLTLEGLRRQIAPVPVEQFVGFLSRHQHARPEAKLLGERGLLALIEQLEGFEAPAGHWEKYLLPGRLQEYASHWLDGLTFSGQVVWGRLTPAARVKPNRALKAMTRATPVALMLREHLSWLLPPVEEIPLSGDARAALEVFEKHGALFPAQLGTLLQLLPSQVDGVLGELAAAGLVTSDGYPALRALMERQRQHRRRSKPAPPATGRWTLLRFALPAATNEERVEQWCRLLLKRYGVMFRDLLANESAAPHWGELVRTYRKLEARGEVRGGRFVGGVAGEQYALPEVIAQLRAEDHAVEPLILRATDPLNFTGRFGDSPRVPALARNAIVLNQGQLQAWTGAREGGTIPR